MTLCFTSVCLCVYLSVCLFVCLSVCTLDCSKSSERNLIKFIVGVGACTRTKWLYSGSNTDHGPADPGFYPHHDRQIQESVKGIFIYYSDYYRQPRIKHESVSREQFKSSLKTWRFTITNTRFDWLIDWLIDENPQLAFELLECF